MDKPVKSALLQQLLKALPFAMLFWSDQFEIAYNLINT